MGKKLTRRGYDEHSIAYIMKARRESTQKTYSVYLRKWARFCMTHNLKFYSPKIPQVCSFLSGLARKGLHYGGMNIARSSLSAVLNKVDGYQVGKHPDVCLLVKGVYHHNPGGPRYERFWNVNKIFDLFRKWGSNVFLSLKLLTFKTALLILLVTSQRGQTVVNLDVSTLELGTEAVFRLKVLLKHNRPGDPLDTVILRPYPDEPILCVVTTLKAYLSRTKNFRPEPAGLLLSYIFPYKPIKRDTLANWAKEVFRMAGLSDKYKLHSTRGATASAAKRLGVALNSIMKHAKWRCVQSFAKHYDKDIDQENEEVSATLLRSSRPTQGIGHRK